MNGGERVKPCFVAGEKNLKLLTKETKDENGERCTRFLTKKATNPVRDVFCMAPKGPTNMLAIECSKPKEAKMVIIMRVATALETKSAAAVETQTAVHTSQLQIMPRATATPKGKAALASATAVNVPAAWEKTPA